VTVSDVQEIAESMSGAFEPFDSDVITSFCHVVHFFSSPALGNQWVQGHRGTFLLSRPDAFELARLSNRRFASALG
jgi:Alkylmercury lyase